jgi:hypothetical protein
VPDLTAGSRVLAADTPPTVDDTQTASFTFNLTTFGIDADSGTYVDCGTAFLAPTTGRVIVHFAASLDNDGANSTRIAPVIREGSTVGSGTEIVAALNDNALLNVGTEERRYGASLLVEGLTPEASYNVRLEHRVSGGNGTIQNRQVIVTPAT